MDVIKHKYDTGVANVDKILIVCNAYYSKQSYGLSCVTIIVVTIIIFQRQQLFLFN